MYSRVPLCMVLCFRQETMKPQPTMVGFDRGVTLHSTSRENVHPVQLTHVAGGYSTLLGTEVAR